MNYLMTNFPAECLIGIALALVGLWLWQAPSRSQMWRWLEFQSCINAEANELKERRRQGRRERLMVEVER